MSSLSGEDPGFPKGGGVDPPPQPPEFAPVCNNQTCRPAGYIIMPMCGHLDAHTNKTKMMQICAP